MDIVPEPVPVAWPHEYPASGWLPEAWKDLTPNQKTSIALRNLEDQSIEDIARTMGCGDSTVRSHLTRCLARLRRRVPELIDGPELDESEER